MKMKDTGERLIVYGDYYQHSPMYLRHKFAYVLARQYTRGKSVLDYGSGSGHGSFYLIENEAERVIGVDISEEAVKYARDRYNHSNLEFRTTHSTGLDFDDETFDVVTSFQVIEHVGDAKIFLQEIKRVLKKPGIALISTPNKNISSYGSAEPENPFHEKEYRSDEFSELLRSCFDKAEVYGVSESPRLRECRDIVDRSLRKRFEGFLNRIHLLTLAQAIIPKRVRYFVSKRPSSKIDISDFILTRSGLDLCLDFIGVCTKT